MIHAISWLVLAALSIFSGTGECKAYCDNSAVETGIYYGGTDILLGA